MQKSIEKVKSVDNNPKKIEWYYNAWVIVGLIFLFGPLGLIPLWFRPNTKRWIKISISFFIISVTILMIVSSGKMYKSVIKTYNDLLEVHPELEDHERKIQNTSKEYTGYEKEL
jgi:hypothetical protein